MLIERLFPSKGGRRVQFGRGTPQEVTYHFTGPDGGPQICDVTDPEHAERLLTQVPTAFRAVKGASAPAPAQSGAGAAEGGAGVRAGHAGASPSMAEARAAYKDRFQKIASPRWSLETILEKLET